MKNIRIVFQNSNKWEFIGLWSWKIQVVDWFKTWPDPGIHHIILIFFLFSFLKSPCWSNPHLGFMFRCRLIWLFELVIFIEEIPICSAFIMVPNSYPAILIGETWVPSSLLVHLECVGEWSIPVNFCHPCVEPWKLHLNYTNYAWSGGAGGEWEGWFSKIS